MSKGYTYTHTNIYCRTCITRFTLCKLNKYKSSTSLNKLKMFLRQMIHDIDTKKLPILRPIIASMRHVCILYYIYICILFVYLYIILYIHMYIARIFVYYIIYTHVYCSYICILYYIYIGILFVYLYIIYVYILFVYC